MFLDNFQTSVESERKTLAYLAKLLLLDSNVTENPSDFQANTVSQSLTIFEDASEGGSRTGA